MIFIENEYLLDLGFDLEKQAKLVINKSLDFLDFPYEVDLNIMFVNNDQVKVINESHRQKDVPTDVLSFPMNDFEIPGDFGWINEEDSIFFSPEDGSFILGDIILNLDRVQTQSVEYGHSQIREFSFLLVHSLLHLIGYDHMEEAEQREMIEVQKKIMSYLEIER